MPGLPDCCKSVTVPSWQSGLVKIPLMAVTAPPRCPRLHVQGSCSSPSQESPGMCGAFSSHLPWPVARRWPRSLLHGPHSNRCRQKRSPAFPWLPSTCREPCSLPPPAVLAPGLSHKLTFVPQAHLPLLLLGTFQPCPLSLKSQEWGSLAVQWLGLHTSPAGGMGSSPCLGAKILHALLCGHQKKKKSIPGAGYQEAFFLPSDSSLPALTVFAFVKVFHVSPVSLRSNQGASPGQSRV